MTQPVSKADTLKQTHGLSTQLGLLTADVKVEASNPGLVSGLNELSNDFKQSNPFQDIREIPQIKTARSAYKELGRNPDRYKVSSEALLKRIQDGKGIYFVNNIVDINNYISILSRHSVGSYDMDKIAGKVSLRIGEEGESYQGIGKGAIDLHRLPVLADAQGPFGSPTSDSERTKITAATTTILMVIYCFDAEPLLSSYLQKASSLLQQFADASNINPIYQT